MSALPHPHPAPRDPLTPPQTAVPVIGLAHGSRHAEGGAAIEQLMDAVAQAGGMPATYAFLDLAEPDLHTAAAAVVAAGHHRAVVVPLLFTVAFHSTIDVPQAVHAAAETSGLELTVADILGTGDDIADLLTAGLAGVEEPRGARGVSPRDWTQPREYSVMLYAVGSSNPAANAAVTDLAVRLQAARDPHEGVPGGRPAVRAAFATCSPRPAEVIDELHEPIAVLPLFLSDGLLLDPVRALAAERRWTMVEPLGERAAGVVLDRYRAAVHEPTDRFIQ
ncbi:MAG TPA: CbiX/SirB N-terminal domain-containing protein [Propionibacteriaceae bacterium]|nr:CbiX/SirB N-terminal domain-containing protein [Propionibacteriaceae bacterium]